MSGFYERRVEDTLRREGPVKAGTGIGQRATSQGAPESWKRQGTDPPPEPVQGAQP